jgi:hypothetical protein
VIGESDDGCHMMIADIDGDHRLWLRGAFGSSIAAVLPIDDDFEQRLAAAARLFRRLRGEPSGPAPPRLRVTPFQRFRLTLLLRIFDREAVGSSKREIASDLVYPGLEPGSSAEWKGSAERRRTQRLCDEAKAMVAEGYRRLLGGR